MGGISDDIADPTPHPFHGDTRGTQGRANNVLESQSYLIDWNDEEKLENLLQRKGNEIAAIITEPICVNGQVKFSKSGYLEKVRQLCTKYNILLIFDEVITGFRISLGGAQKYLGIMPDITVLGKALAGGTLPLSAVVGKKDIMDLYTKNKVVHANTFNGYTLGLTAAKATLEILSSNEDVYKYMESQFIKITGAFQQEAKKYNFNINILGHPTCSAFDCSSWDENDRFDSKTLNTVLSRTMLEEGILLSNTTTFYSNISITDDDIELFKSRLPNVFNAAVAKIEKLK